MTTEALDKPRVSTWQIDRAHSTIEFAVKHFVVTTVKGYFRDFEGRFAIDEENPANSWVEASIDVASIDTNVPERDAHLRSDDFFNAEKYPKITFRSTRVEPVAENKARVYGDLTIRDVTREVVLDVEFEGFVQDPWGNRRAAFTATTSLRRSDFGVRWNQPLETGGWVVSDEVKVNLYIEAIEQKEGSA
jgi:polyisoprenoid-binding protein YceI